MSLGGRTCVPLEEKSAGVTKTPQPLTSGTQAAELPLPLSWPRRPLPVADPWSQGYWEHARAQRLAMQRCCSCGHLAYPPVRLCNQCCHLPPEFDYRVVSGRGVLRSWTLVETAFLDHFEVEGPLVLGDVELEEQSGLRMVARLIGVDFDDVVEYMALRAVFEDIADGISLPAFEPDRST
jgi:uncharacterized OB-fold protein